MGIQNDPLSPKARRLTNELHRMPVTEARVQRGVWLCRIAGCMGLLWASDPDIAITALGCCTALFAIAFVLPIAWHVMRGRILAGKFLRLERATGAFCSLSMTGDLSPADQDARRAAQRAVASVLSEWLKPECAKRTPVRYARHMRGLLSKAALSVGPADDPNFIVAMLRVVSEIGTSADLPNLDYLATTSDAPEIRGNARAASILIGRRAARDRRSRLLRPALPPGVEANGDAQR